MRRLFAAFFLFSMFAVAVPSFGDIARPTPSSKPGKFVTHSGLEIVPDAKAYEARLEIPQDLFREMRAGLADVPADPNLARRIAHSSPRTILAGVFLFMSVSFAGVWLARSRQRNQKIIAAVVLAAALLGAATIITKANAGPPGYVRWQGLPQALTDGRSTQAGVDIVIVSEGSGVKLIVPMRKANRNPGEE
jgi:hypothetical protein